MEDPILDAMVKQAPEGMFGEEHEPVAPGLYGEGLHKGAKLLDVVTYPKSEHGFGYRIGLKLDLRPGTDGIPFGSSLEYTARFDLERTLEANGHDLQDWMFAKEAKKRKFLNDALSAFDFNRDVEQAIDTEEQYEAICNIFRQQAGKLCDVKIGPDGKNSKNDDGTWHFEPNGYTKTLWIKKTRVKA